MTVGDIEYRGEWRFVGSVPNGAGDWEPDLQWDFYNELPNPDPIDITASPQAAQFAPALSSIVTNPSAQCQAYYDSKLASWAGPIDWSYRTYSTTANIYTVTPLAAGATVSSLTAHNHAQAPVCDYDRNGIW